MSLVELKYAAYARVACWADSKMPGTGPEMSATFAIVIVLSVMPVWFLKPLQEPALVLPVAALSPVPWVPPAGASEPPPVLPPPVVLVPPPAVEPGTEPSGDAPPSEPPAAVPAPPTACAPVALATVLGSSCEPHAASATHRAAAATIRS